MKNGFSLLNTLLALPVLAVGFVLFVLTLRGLQRGVITPFRMGRWRRSGKAVRPENPFRFRLWVVVYLLSAFCVLVVALLTFMGRIPLS